MPAVGRPTKYTPRTVSAILAALREGNYRNIAARVSGVHPDSFYEWLGLYSEFSDAVETAEAEAEARIVAQWQRHIPENWQAGRDFLARRHPDRWANTEKQEHSGQLAVTPISIIETARPIVEPPPPPPPPLKTPSSLVSDTVSGLADLVLPDA